MAAWCLIQVCVVKRTAQKKMRKDPYESNWLRIVEIMTMGYLTRIYVDKTLLYGKRKRMYWIFFYNHPPSTHNFFICCTLVSICYLKESFFCYPNYFHTKHIIISVCHCSVFNVHSNILFKIICCFYFYFFCYHFFAPIPCNSYALCHLSW